jgi:hypothetical protein
MAAPSLVTRQTVYERDNGQCVLCGTTENPTFQHRRAVGAGGSKILPSPVDGCVLDLLCNQQVEADPILAKVALARGIKVKRWADPSLVPIFVAHEFGWFRLDGIARVRIPSVVAIDAMHAVYGDEYFTFKDDEMSRRLR